MASVDFAKYKGANEVKAALCHCDELERTKHKHSNKNIDISKTHLNVQLKPYEETCKTYDKFIQDLDNNGNKNKRKDRVTAFGLDIPVPEHLCRSDYSEWFGRVNGILSDMYDEKNVIGMYQHYDEEHAYIDAETHQERVSRVHEHVYIVPEHDGQLNGKWFSSRANMRKLNNAIDTMTFNCYGVYFNDGTKKKSKSDVETLKNASLRAENDILEKNNIKLSQRAFAMVTKETALNDKELYFNIKHKQREIELDKREKALKARESDLDTREGNLSIKEQDVATANATAVRLQQDLNAKETRLSDYEDRLNTTAKAQLKTAKALYDTKKILDEMPSPDDALVKFAKRCHNHGKSLYDMFVAERKNNAAVIKRALPPGSEDMLKALANKDPNNDDDCDY